MDTAKLKPSCNIKVDSGPMDIDKETDKRIDIEADKYAAAPSKFFNSALRDALKKWEER